METFFGNEIVAGTRRLALMNLFLHNIGDIESDNFISPADASIAASPTTYNYVLANPPFGKKSSQTFTNDEGEQEKDDLTYNCFWQKAHRSRYNESRGKPFKGCAVCALAPLLHCQYGQN